jgi:hypothetical protein
MCDGFAISHCNWRRYRASNIAVSLPIRCSLLDTHYSCSYPLQPFALVDAATQRLFMYFIDLHLSFHAKFSQTSLKLLSYKGFFSTSLTHNLHGLS